MYYVFYETGDNDFFRRIARKYCEALVGFIEAHYGRNAFKSANDIVLNDNLVKDFFDREKETLCPLNCGLVLGESFVCPTQECKECRDAYRAVIASDQEKEIAHSMQDVRKDKNGDFYKKMLKLSPRDRSNIQGILESLSNINKLPVVEIPIANSNEYKKNNLPEYKRLYAKGAKKIIKKKAKASDSFMYVRTNGAGSDYDYYVLKEKLTDLKECNELQAVK